MEASEVAGYSKYTVDIGTASRLEACFTDGKGSWDSNNMNNYFFAAGTWTYSGNGQITAGAPAAARSANVMYLAPGAENSSLTEEEPLPEEASQEGAEAA